MEKTIRFDLPNDDGKKKVVAATLTAAVCALVASGLPDESALSKVHQIYTDIVSPPRSLSEWEDNG